MITTNRSQLGFVHGFSLPSDVVLGDDRVRPLIVEDPSVIRWPCPLLLDGFSSPHSTGVAVRDALSFFWMNILPMTCFTLIFE